MLRQTVRITGYGSTAFKSVLDEAHEIYAIFDRSLDGEKQPIDFISNVEGGGQVFAVSNRFFTPSTQSHTPMKSIANWMDPQGHLGAANGKDVVYTEDNEVEYFKARVTDDKW